MEQRGKEHPVQNLIQEVRTIFLRMGFDEVENPVFIPETDIYKQYGEEAPIILDRIYYLAALPRPDIGLESTVVQKIKEISTNIEIAKLKKILKSYRAGSIESDNLVEKMMKKLNISYKNAIQLTELFTDFKNLVPESSKTTLRSHMTSAWFRTIAAIQHKIPMPIKLFSIGLRFRREQKMDAQHLRVHYGASCVIIDRNVDIEYGKKITKTVLKKLGFSDVKFIRKDVTSNYYEYGTEYEVFSNNIEIADIGMYSQTALKNYSIDYPVFNLGFGLERILMVRQRYKDVREIVYPQFYSKWKVTDGEIAKSITFIKIPKTDIGKEICRAVRTACVKYKDKKTPCKVLAYETKYRNKKIKVFIIKTEKNKKLCGSALLNEIIVKNGSVYGLPRSEKFKDYFLNCAETKLHYIDAFAHLVGAEMEYRIQSCESFKIDIKMVKHLSDINLKIAEHARKYIIDNAKKIDVKGPMFISVVCEKE
jgi:O-phosphoseryl-tRNA synthetase